jgi:hypothetical protein
MSTIADRAVLDSPLFKLPPELRDVIYEYAVGSDPKTTCKKYDAGNPFIESSASYNVQDSPLLHVCRTIRREALEFFLARPPYEVSLYVGRNGEVSLDFWEHEGSSIFSKSNSERDKVTSTLRRPHYRVWADLTRWLREAEEVLDRGGDVSRVARRTMTVSCYALVAISGIIRPVERRKSIDFGLVSSFSEATSSVAL